MVGGPRGFQVCCLLLTSTSASHSYVFRTRRGLRPEGAPVELLEGLLHRPLNYELFPPALHGLGVA